jgi:hypothetical protein
MIGGGKGKAVPHDVGTSWRADRENVRGIDQPKLDTCDRTSVAVREQDSPFESCVPAQPTDFANDALSIR